MKKLALTAAALTLGITAASAQSQPGESGTVMLAERVADRLPGTLEEVAAKAREPTSLRTELAGNYARTAASWDPPR